MAWKGVPSRRFELTHYRNLKDPVVQFTTNGHEFEGRIAVESLLIEFSTVGGASERMTNAD
jgi:hypothetical protein